MRVTQRCPVCMWTCNEPPDVCLECWPEDHQHLLWQEATNLLFDTSSEGSSQTEGEVFLCFFFFLSCLFVGWLVGFLAVLHKNYRFSTDFLKTWTRNCISPELTLLTFSADLEKEVPGIYLLLLIHAPMKLRVTMCYMLLHIYPGVLEVLVESLALSETQRAERSLVCSGLCLCFLPIM